MSGNEKLLELSAAIIERIIEAYPNTVNTQINMFQIEKRLGGKLSKESFDKLEALLDDSGLEPNFQRKLQFCAEVLRDSKEGALAAYKDLSKDDRMAVEGYPIMTLYKSLLGLTE